MFKPIQLLSLLPRRPGEFLGRVMMIAESRIRITRVARPQYDVIHLDGAVDLISRKGFGDLQSRFGEQSILNIEDQVSRGIRELPVDAPFPFMHHGDALLARCCYAIVRVLVPNIVVETGVCYGVTSAYLLQALRSNGGGQLHSLDLPPLGRHGGDFVGRLVPTENRAQWTLHRGLSGKLLPPLLDRLGPIDMFVHDSLHTHRTMSREFALAWPALRPGGVLVADDIEGNTAFQELSRQPDVAFSVVLKETGKDALLGIAGKKR